VGFCGLKERSSKVYVISKRGMRTWHHVRLCSVIFVPVSFDVGRRMSGAEVVEDGYFSGVCVCVGLRACRLYSA